MFPRLVRYFYRVKHKHHTMSKFVITKKNSGEFQFYLQSGNGQTLLSSESYLTKTSCENAIFSVRTNLRDASKLVSIITIDGKAYFNLKAINERVLGTSELYENQSAMLNGIELLKTYAPFAQIEDLTA